ncbi:tetratricopeptide repeat protein [Luedemannella flava]
MPGDWPTWARLGLAYVERARVTADPAYYPKAEGALRESLRLRPDGNADALTGLGALANARHDFAAARSFAQQALRLNGFDAAAYGVLADAHTQLGEAKQATAAVQKMLDLRPELPALARAAYDLEQHGRVADARDLWLRALDQAPLDAAYIHTQLGDLAWHTGDRAEARARYAAALDAQPGFPAAQPGLARVLAADGDADAALAVWARVTRRTPAPSLLIEYAGELRRVGRYSDADSQFDLAEAALRLFAASGGRDDLGEAELAIARGDADRAVAAARREWSRRTHADVADVLGWALHLAGDDAAALRYARAAASPGSRDTRYADHLAAIESALRSPR